MDHLLTAWTIRLAVLCLFAVLISRAWPLMRQLDSQYSQPNMGVRSIWLAGAILSLIHTICAFGFFHEWSHTAAVNDTALQTDELLGFRFGGGLYFNYVFVVLWLGDAIWLIFDSRSYFQRPSWIGYVVIGYLLFIAINGTIVFETGISRWGGVVLLATLVICKLFKTNQIKNPGAQ